MAASMTQQKFRLQRPVHVAVPSMSIMPRLTSLFFCCLMWQFATNADSAARSINLDSNPAIPSRELLAVESDMSMYPNITVAPNNKLLAAYAAKGVQIYSFNGSGFDPTPANVSAFLYRYDPDAKDLKLNEECAGYHFYSAGGVPTWEIYEPYQLVMGKVLGRVPQEHSIAWVLLQVVNETSSGLPSVSFVQRRSTDGGLPPSLPKAAVSVLKPNDRVQSRYSAVYDFYTPI